MRPWAPLAPFLLAAAASVHAQDLPGFGTHETCKSAIDAEIARGSKMKEPPSNPDMKDFYGTATFKGTFNGRSATVIYLCSGTKASEGLVGSQLIYIERPNESEVSREFARQRNLLQARLGSPCRELADGHPRVAWKRDPGIVTLLYWSPSGGSEPKWNVIIQTIHPDNPSPIACSSD
jgi:hypothetical protein